MKAVQLLINSKLPEDLRDYNRSYDAKDIGNLMAEIAERYPERYEELAQVIGDVGRNASYLQGESLKLSDMSAPFDKEDALASMDAEVEAVRKTTKDKKEFERERMKIWARYAGALEKTTMDTATKKGNNIAYSVASGARGKSNQLKMMVTTPALYTDYKDEPVNLFVRNSFGEGLRPAEYFAGTFGARKSVISTKVATAKGGDFCLDKNTMVRMADDSVRPLKSIKKGDYVLGADTSCNTFPVEVTKVFDQGEKPAVSITYNDRGELIQVVCTREHKWLIRDKFGARQIVDSHEWTNRTYLLKELDTVGIPARDLEIKNVGLVHCMDIEVAHTDHLFVLANGMITSNSKQLLQSAAKLIVTEEDCQANSGIDLEPDDSSLLGRVTYQDRGNIKAGTLITPAILKDLSKSDEPVMVRSALTCQAENGVCSKCVGALHEGRKKLPSVGDSVGVTASQAIGEPVCLEENTEVRMADFSVKKIKDMQRGDMVLGSDLKGHLSPVPVLNVFHNGPRSCVETIVKKGYGKDAETVKLHSTKEHKVLSSKSRRGFTAKIQPIATPDSERVRHSVYMGKGLIDHTYGRDEPLAGVIGVLIGDGCYTGGVHNKGVGLSCYDPLLEEYIRRELKSIDVKLSSQGKGEFRLSMTNQHKARKGYDVNKEWHPIKLWFNKEGMWGQNSSNKILPKSIWEWNNVSISRLIGGYISADGWICSSKTGVTIGMGSNSQELLLGIKQLLEVRFGIYCTRITKKQKKRPDGTFYDPNYTLTIGSTDSILEFYKRVRIPGVRQSKLDEAINTLKPQPKERGRFKVVSQTDIGTKDTWDIEVDNETHLFLLANGLIVSNTQMSLNSKHQGGVFGGKREYSGFNVFNQIVQNPSVFPHKAELSKSRGVVSRIEDAPQGGKFVYVGDEQHYVRPDYDVLVKPGQNIEKGTQLSSGIIKIEDVIETKGLGEGRRFFSKYFKDVLDRSGVPADLRNTEIIARSALDHVTIDDPEGIGHYLPDDVVSYNDLLRVWNPDEKTQKYDLKKSKGKFLQAPALHYSVGTEMTDEVIDRLRKTGHTHVQASDNKPNFTPKQIRLRTAGHSQEDWLAKSHTSYLKDNLRKDATRGRDTNVLSNTHFAPRLAYGEGFGKNKSQGTF